MTEFGHSIDLNLSEKLRNPEYRKRFFWAEASSAIADQLIKLRKRRELSQKDLAEKIGTQQPAISRVERADYQNWNLNNLRSIADAMDARIRVLIEPAEDVLPEYESAEVEQEAKSVAPDDLVATPLGGHLVAEYTASPDGLVSVLTYKNLPSFSNMPTTFLSLAMRNYGGAMRSASVTPAHESSEVIALRQRIADLEAALADKREAESSRPIWNPQDQGRLAGYRFGAGRHSLPNSPWITDSNGVSA